MVSAKPNKRFEPTAQKLRFWVPSALRAPAPINGTLGPMSISHAIVGAIGETVAFVVGRIAGKTFNLEPKRAQRIGEIIVLCVIFGALRTYP